LAALTHTIRPMRFCLFDWNEAGHNPLYMKSFAEALLPDAEVVLAAPDRALDRIEPADVEIRPLGGQRPQPTDAKGMFERDGKLLDKAAVANEEIALVERVCAEVRPDQLVMMHADPVLRWLATRRRSFSFQHSICVFQARAHYRSAYGTRLSLGERARAQFQDFNVRRWQRRGDAHTVFALDRVAAERWSKRRGAAAKWLPEPPIPAGVEPLPGEERSGCILFGRLAPRKGLDLLADALEGEAAGFTVTVAGEVEPSYEGELKTLLKRMRDNGIEVRDRTGRLSDDEVMHELASARCAVLPYRFHAGTSRVLTEAAAAGTPVVAPDHGLVAHLVREYGIGLAVDPTDAAALRSAVLRISDPDEFGVYEANLHRYTEEFGGGAFRREVRAAFGLGDSH
jgi:hypothetical protein